MAFLGGLGGGVLGAAVIELGVDTRKLTSGMDTARRQVGAGATDMERRMSAWKGAIIAGAALAGAALVKFGADSVRAFEESQKALLQLSIAVGGNTQAYQEQAHALQELTGYQDEEIMAAQAVLARFQLTQQQLLELVPLILDYARATGVDAATAAGNIGRALLGNARALKAVGIQFTATGDQAKDLQTIMAALQDRVGGTAEAFGRTFAGQMQILSADFDDFKEKVGELIVNGLKPLLPVLTRLVGVLNVIAPQADILLGILVGYFALRGLPLLLGQVAAGLQAVGAAAAASRVAATGMAASLTSLGPILLGITTVLIAGHEAWKVWHGDASDLTDVVLPDLAGKTEFLGIKLSDLGIASIDAAGKITTLTEADQIHAQALQEEADAAREAKDALDSLAGGVLGLAADSRSYLDAQKEVNKLQRAGKDDTRAYEDAVFALAQQGLGLRDDLVGLIDKTKTANASWHDAKQELFGAAKQMGITRDQVKTILGPLGEVRRELGYFNKQLDTLDGRKVNVEIITHYIETGKLQ